MMDKRSRYTIPVIAVLVLIIGGLTFGQERLG